jgi:hypothetical protein
LGHDFWGRDVLICDFLGRDFLGQKSANQPRQHIAAAATGKAGGAFGIEPELAVGVGESGAGPF